jgi:endonuclease-3
MEEVEIVEILAVLDRLYPQAACALTHRNPFELLIATILSAQCTDLRVNQVTRELFAEGADPQAMADLGLERIRQLIRGCGLFNNKAANILATCQKLLALYGGRVPDTREALEALPGVGRKTANVILSNAFGQPAIAVDTHVFRVAHRLGLSGGVNPRRTEEDLMALIPRERWSHSHHLFIFHGRNLCQARRPQCGQCPLQAACKYYQGSLDLETGNHR